MSHGPNHVKTSQNFCVRELSGVFYVRDNFIGGEKVYVLHGEEEGGI